MQEAPRWCDRASRLAMGLVVLASVLPMLTARSASSPDASAPPPPTSQPAASPAPTTPAAPRLFSGLGSYHRSIHSQNDATQRYFDQGLALLYGFNHEEARRSFEEAARLDPSCAICWWGAAIVLGPNINLPADPEASKAAFAALEKARAAREHATPVERDLIDALSKRYVAEPPADRKSLDVAYAGAMREVKKRHPDDPDVATLFAEAMMDLRPWDLWMADGKPQPGTRELIAALEGVLAKHPDHPGANHYYVHAVEASPHPEKAVASAKRLETLVPAAGHLVHMPAHIWQRIGKYQEAAEANAQGAQADRAYFATIGNADGVYPMIYYNHNLHFRAVSLLFDGQSAGAIAAIDELKRNVTLDMVQAMPMAEFVVPIDLFAGARLGRWNDLLAAAAPPEKLLYTTAIWHWARGLALAETGQAEAARAELTGLETAASHIAPDFVVGINLAGPVVEIAEHHLEGVIAAKTGKSEEAIAELEKAVAAESRLKYDEPPPWPVPTREWLGATLLEAGRARDAEKVYRADLTQYPENGWSLFGLAKSLRAQRKNVEAAAVESRFEKAWARADVTLTTSRY